jgi:hypothetical protein
MKPLNAPVIKESRLDVLVGALRCFEDYPMNRDKQRDCVLSMYKTKPGKDSVQRDKSIFRGMVVSSLAHLGFIVGDGAYLRASSNGHLAVVASKCDALTNHRVLAALFYEIDSKSFHFLDLIQSSSNGMEVTRDTLVQTCSSGQDFKQKQERVHSWLTLLEQAGLVTDREGSLLPLYSPPDLQADLAVSQDDINTWFRSALFEAYDAAKEANGICDIVKLRARLAEEELLTSGRIVTRNRFDQLMQKLPFEGTGYMLSFGSPISGGQELLEYYRQLYKTIIISRAKGDDDNAGR